MTHTKIEPIPPLWMPKPESVERTNIFRFQQWLAASKPERLFGDYEALWSWSVSDLEGFWSAIWNFFRLNDVSKYNSVLEIGRAHV